MHINKQPTKNINNDIIVEFKCFKHVSLFISGCPIGFYGVNCAWNCSSTCWNPGKCDRVTGHCNGGCQRGWTGDMCEKGKC